MRSQEVQNLGFDKLGVEEFGPFGKSRIEEPGSFRKSGVKELRNMS